MDPFLLLDEFKSNDPRDYSAGFPWHPHRGIETVTYMLGGRVEHGDSVGNSGVIGPGDMQWMTAGKGIIHQEMPQRREGLLWGLQLWINLPAAEKMCAPRYRGVTAAEIPEVPLGSGGAVKVVCGAYADVSGPVADVTADPLYLDIRLPAGAEHILSVREDRSVFCYCLEGAGRFGEAGQAVEESRIVLFGGGDHVRVTASEEGMRFLLVSGKALGEPIARGGPFVMNTEEEIRLAFEQYRNGTFLD